MSKVGFFLKVQKFVIKNAPTILSVMGAVGTITAVAMSSDAALKSKRIIKAEEFKRQNADICKKYLPANVNPTASESDLIDICKKNGITTAENNAIVRYNDRENSKLSKADKALIYIKCYAPTAIMTAASIFCIFGSNHISKQRIASLAGAYILKEKAFDEYKEKAEEMLGKKKADELKNDIIQKHIDENPQTDANTVNTNLPNAMQLSLWWDEQARRYFYSNAEYIRRAELEATAMLKKNGYVDVNDFYDILGLEHIPLAENLGWDNTITDEVTILIGSALMGPDVPVGTINFEVHPTSAWLADV